MTSLTAYIDESYGSSDYYLAAVVAKPDQVGRLVRSFDLVRADLQSRWGVGGEIEFHAHHIMQGVQDWDFLSGLHHEAFSIYRNLLLGIVDSGVQVFLEGVDVARLKGRYRYPDSPHEVALRHLLERVDDYCAALVAPPCRVVCDELGPNQTLAFTEAVAGYTRARTPGYRPSALSHIHQPIEWASSADNPGIQAADLAVYILRRQREHQGSPRANRAARSLVGVLKPAIRHERKWVP